MNMGATELGGIFAQHYESLPRWDREGLREHTPWIVLFGGLPVLVAVGIQFADLNTKAIAVGLLAGVGALGGLLFQVLAWISGRIGTIADTMDARPVTGGQLDLVERLDIARTNTAYAAIIAIFFVMDLGVGSMLGKTPTWLNTVNGFLLIHFGVTLMLVVVRINSIGKSDRVTALTAQARARRAA